MNNSYVIGIDFGTDSVRALLIDAGCGSEIASSVFYYPRWKEQLYCRADLNQFRQHPLDYIEGMEHTVKECIRQAGPGIAAHIRAISVDTTGSTPVAVDEYGVPLALRPGFEDNPNAMFVLWKDHTAVEEAEAINLHAGRFPTNYLEFVGGVYSSEWFWAKLLHVLRTDEAVRHHCYSWVEHCDWIPFLLTGGRHVGEMKRSICAAGHKALWSEQWNGLPREEFFASLDPLLAGFRKRLFKEVFTSDKKAGHLGAEWARRLGLPATVAVGIGAFDCHMGAVGGQIEPYHLSKVMGTSTCDMVTVPMADIGQKKVAGICGQVPGSIIPGMMGMEAGQSAFGDAYAWFRNLLCWPLQHLPAHLSKHVEAGPGWIEDVSDGVLAELGARASALAPEADAELSIDWLNGRRTPYANQLLKGAITGLNLGSDAPRIFRSLVEATCFGAKAIVEQFRAEGIPIKGIIGLGGVARKSPFIMQTMADVLDMPIHIHRSEQTCALGAAMFAATAAGLYERVEDAMQAMGQGFDKVYLPDSRLVPIYGQRYQRYKALGSFLEGTGVQDLFAPSSLFSNQENLIQL